MCVCLCYFVLLRYCASLVIYFNMYVRRYMYICLLKICQKIHWSSHHCQFHIDSTSEQQVVVSSPGDVRRREMQNNNNNNNDTDSSSYQSNNRPIAGGRYGDSDGEDGDVGMPYEYYVLIFMLFYGSFWYVLKIHADDEQDL
jgi:hypothetical protein